MPRKLMKRRVLERLLGSLTPSPSPKVQLEQYTIPEELAAKILSLAAYTFNDITGKFVVDLGCGSGRLAIGAAILGAAYVVGVDLDPEAIKAAKANAERLGVKAIVDWVLADIETLKGLCDTVLQNPPYGTKKRGADVHFLEKAMEIGRIVYSLHKSATDAYVRKFVARKGALITGIFKTKIRIPKTFPFHSRRVYYVDVNLYRIECKKPLVGIAP
ncbi:MAG: METTL5 family protein [Candidatus Bathyarchaeia archaeon]